MDEATRAIAIEKLKKLKVNYNILRNFQAPNVENEIMNLFHGLKLTGNTYFDNTLAIRRLQIKNDFKKLNSTGYVEIGYITSMTKN